MTDVRERNRAKKDYLRQYLFLVREQEGLEQMLAELIEDYASPKSPQLDAMPKGGEPRDMSDYVIRHSNLLKRLQDLKAEKWLAQERILGRIEEVDDARERQLLTLRYINGYSFRRIARELCCSEDYVLHIHGSALSHFNV